MKRLSLALLSTALWLTPMTLPAVDLDAIEALAAQGNVSEAIDELDTLINEGQGNVTTHFLRATLLAQSGRDAEARGAFAEIGQRFPQLPEAWNNLAALQLKSGDYEGARQSLLQGLSNTPEYATAQINLADLYLKMATDAYERAVEMDPGDQAAQARLDHLRRMFGDG